MRKATSPSAGSEQRRVQTPIREDWYLGIGAILMSAFRRWCEIWKCQSTSRVFPRIRDPGVLMSEMGGLAGLAPDELTRRVGSQLGGPAFLGYEMRNCLAKDRS